MPPVWQPLKRGPPGAPISICEPAEPVSNSSMRNTAWDDAIQTCADPQRARHYLDQLRATSAATALKSASPEQARIVVALLSGSQALSESLITHPDWITVLQPENLSHPRQEQGLRRDVSHWLPGALKSRDYSAAFGKLREFKQREMLRIAARDLARLTHTTEIMVEISTVADVCLDTVLRICWQQLTERLGIPYHLDAGEEWQPTKFCVLGLGKLGGQELNYSSDVDVIFLYE